MASVLDSHLAEIPDLCRRYGVARLELFGSAAGDAFDPQRSDLDFLVEFDADSSRLFDRFFGLKESLEALYGRPGRRGLHSRGHGRQDAGAPSTRRFRYCWRKSKCCCANRSEAHGRAFP